MTSRNSNFNPRIIPPREPRLMCRPCFWIAAFLILLIVGGTLIFFTTQAYVRGFTTGSDMANTVWKSGFEGMAGSTEKDTSAPDPEQDDGAPASYDLHATPVDHGVSEELPENDIPPPPPKQKPHRVTKTEPLADELNVRWFVRHPHGAPTLEPLE